MMRDNIESILESLEFPYSAVGEPQKFEAISSITEASERDLSFCYYEGEKATSLINKSKAAIIICKKSLEETVRPHPDRKQQLIFVENPRFVIVKVINLVYEKKKPSGIAPNAVISATSLIGNSCYIGHNVVIGDNCKIGDNTIIYDRVSIVQNTTIGDNCIIQPGVTLGADGFAFERYEDEELIRFPHIKGVRVGNNVEICANTNIARGSLSDTIIGDGTKIDAMVQIAHNVVIGRNSEITTGTIIGGSTKIGDSCWTGLNSTLKDNIHLGDNVLVAAGAVVIKDVPDKDIVAGVPARSIKEKVKSDMLFVMAGQKKDK
jgi:UDP-3-O-[3-hydroxymyristoyl] glucosamine N-acyltransferase